MADRYWVAGGTGNYNSNTNWSASSGGVSGASVPSTADDVFFDASSGVGTATINVASNCRSLNLTGFLGTLQFNFNLTLNGTILNLGTGGYTIITPSTFGLALNTAMTITSNGTVWSGIIGVGNTAITLADNLNISGEWRYLTTGTSTVNGNTLNISGSLIHSTTAIATGTTNIVFDGTGTWSHSSTGVLRNNVTINTLGTITISGTIRYNTGTLTYVAGTVVTTGNNLIIGVSTTLNTNGIIWDNITTFSNMTITLSSDLTLIGNLSHGVGGSGTLTFVLGGNSLITTNANLVMNSSSAIFSVPQNLTFKSLNTNNGQTLNGNTVTFTEDISIGSGALSGTTAIVYGGTGTWTALNTSSVINNNFTINTAGTLTISGNVYKGTGVFTYTAGTIIDTGATVHVGTSSATINVSSFTWEKLLVQGTTTLSSDINATTFGTWGNSNVTFLLGGNSLNFTNLQLGNTGTTTLPTAWVCQDILFNPTSTMSLNTNSITINGNITQENNGASAGTTTITYAGTGSWQVLGGTGRIANSFTINTAGTLTIISAGIGGGIFTYTAGTVITTGSTLFIRAAGTTMNHGSIVWYNVTLGNSINSGSVGTLVLNNQLVCSNFLVFGLSNTTFSGTDGTFDTYYLYFGSAITGTTVTTIVSGKTYTVRKSLIANFAPDGTYPILLRSSTPGAQAIFTLLQGSTIDVGFLNATDIDSSLGRPIYSYRGVFSNTLNWGLLPTDNSRASRSTFVG